MSKCPAQFMFIHSHPDDVNLHGRPGHQWFHKSVVCRDSNAVSESLGNESSRVVLHCRPGKLTPKKSCEWYRLDKHFTSRFVSPTAIVARVGPCATIDNRMTLRALGGRIRGREGNSVGALGHSHRRAQAKSVRTFGCAPRRFETASDLGSLHTDRRFRAGKSSILHSVRTRPEH